MSHEQGKRRRRNRRTGSRSMPADDARKHFTQWPEKVIGAKYVRLLEKQLRQMRNESTHGNRQLFLDDVFGAYLLAFFNPMVRCVIRLDAH